MRIGKTLEYPGIKGVSEIKLPRRGKLPKPPEKKKDKEPIVPPVDTGI